MGGGLGWGYRGAKRGVRSIKGSGRAMRDGGRTWYEELVQRVSRVLRVMGGGGRLGGRAKG